MTPPASGYFTASATTPPMPAWFYFSACSNMDATQISCPNPDRRRQLQFGPTGGGVMAIQYWGETPCEAGAPCTLQDSCATLGTFPPPTCIANGTAGLICSYSGGSGARSVDLDFVCAQSLGSMTGYQKGDTSYVINIPGPAGCPGGGGAAAAGGLSWGSLFLILLSVAIVVYVGGGLAYNIKVKEMEPGVDAIMHLEYWKQLPGLVKDGCDFSYKHTKAAYVAFQNRNRDPALSAPIAKAEGGDDDMSRALGS